MNLSHDGRRWIVRAPPHVMLRLKRVFPRANPAEFGAVALADTIEVCRDLAWFRERYPLEMERQDLLRLEGVNPNSTINFLIASSA